MCPQGYRDINQEDEDGEDEDEENPEDDPDVQDIRWFWRDCHSWADSAFIL